MVNPVITSSPRRKPKVKWTPAEEQALKSGVKKHGAGKWRSITKDPDFGPCLASRTNIDLKDKWRNICGESSYKSKLKAVPIKTHLETLWKYKPTKSVCCNPADVEVYTEVERQGKRTGKEMTNCFDNSRKQDAGNEVYSGDESTVSDTGASEDSVEISSKCSRGEISGMMRNPCNGSLCTSAKRIMSRDRVDVLVDAIELIDSRDLVRVSREPTADKLVPDRPKENKMAVPNLLRKRSRERPPQNCAIQKKAVKKFKSSKMVDLSNLETLMMAVNHVSKDDDDEVPTINRRIRKTLDGGVRKDAVSPVCLAASVSDGSSGDNLDTLGDNMDKDITKSYWKSDGGEHNPLVNRARICMSKLPAEEKETHSTVDKSSEAGLVNKSVSVSSGNHRVLDDMSANTVEDQSSAIKKLTSFQLSILPEGNTLASDQSLGNKKLTSSNLGIPPKGNTGKSLIKSSKVFPSYNEKDFSRINSDQGAHSRTAQQMPSYMSSEKSYEEKGGNVRGCEYQKTSIMTSEQRRLQKNFSWRERKQRLDAEAEAYILKDRQRQHSFLMQHFKRRHSVTNSQLLQAPPPITNQHVQSDTSGKISSGWRPSYNEKGFVQTVCGRREGQRAAQQRRKASVAAEKSRNKLEEHLSLLRRLRRHNDVELRPMHRQTISKFQV